MTRPFVTRALAAIVMAVAGGALPASTASAGPHPCTWDVPPRWCDEEIPPQPEPGPIDRSVVFYDFGDLTAAPAVYSRVDELLDRVAPANRARLAGRTVTVHVIPRDWNLTDLPLWTYLTGRRLEDLPNDSYEETRTWDETRGAGGATGYCDGPLHVAIGEEQVVMFPGSPHPSPERARLGSLLAHELGHVIECAGLTPIQRQTLATLHAAAAADFAAGDTGDIVYSEGEFNGRSGDPGYTVLDQGEFFAEATAAWFEWGDTRFRRQWLTDHDPALYALLDEVFAVPPPVPNCDGERATTVITTAGTSFTGMPGRDVIVGSSGPDVIDGATGDDELCGNGGNDTIRGGHGNDAIFGGDGDDVLDGGHGDDLLWGEAGDDLLDGGPGDDSLAGLDGDDLLVDTVGTDELLGGAGRDHLNARDAQGPTPDWLEGGPGLDHCAYDDNEEVISSCLQPVGGEPIDPPIGNA